MATLHLPTGEKIRTGSQRRYVVVKIYTDKTEIAYRTDDAVKASKRATEYVTLMRRAGTMGATAVMDTQDGHCVEQFDLGIIADAKRAQAAIAADYVRTVVKARREAPKVKPEGAPCQCECGGTTGGGRFLPGHDAKLKSKLIKTVMDSSKTSDEQKAAHDRLEQLGWTRFLEKAQEVASRTPADRVRIKQERAEITAEQAEARTRLVEGMKEAWALLKAARVHEGIAEAGDSEHVLITRDNYLDIIAKYGKKEA